MPSKGAIKQISVGTRFGRLITTGPLEQQTKGHPRAPVLCDCGATAYVSSTHLRSGHTQSCGCLHREITGLVNRTHGLRNTSTFRSWSGMRQRCSNPKNTSYTDYGGRGIRVCARWQESFEAFVSDMGVALPGYSIERNDNHGNYEPGNCKWIPMSEQARNKRTNHRVTLNGEEMCLAEALRSLGAPRGAYSNMSRRKRVTPQQVVDFYLCQMPQITQK